MAVQIIAEIGSVHDGSFGNALWLTRAAGAAGAGVVKFQTHIAAAETLRRRRRRPTSPTNRATSTSSARRSRRRSGAG